ncbi:MAG: hypothetical protein QOC72_3233, partial [Methylobacteriaceae bacterium]|nr:hypothetical protein [Methylobacteriaceae bacterium]
TGTLAPELTYSPGPIYRCTTVPLIGEKMVDAGSMRP